MTLPIYQGLALHEAGKLREAEQIYRQILAQNPNDPDALHLLGLIASQSRQYQAGRRLVEAAIRLRPDVAMYHNNLGNIFRELHELGLAEMCYRRALELQDDYAEPRVNLATIIREQAQFEEAVVLHEDVVRRRPDYADGYCDLGTVLLDQGRIDEVMAAYRRAIDIDPRCVAAHANLLYALHNSERSTWEEQFSEHLRWGKLHADPLGRSVAPYANDRSPNRRLRIGYVSPDFRDHPVARFLWPLIEHRDRAAFEIVCFSSVEREDDLTARYRSAVDEWQDVRRLNDEALAELVRARQIDILVDLAGHTHGGRLLAFARRPAPVQITHIGYPNTTGMAALDLRITDALADPPGEADARHVEKLVRVDGCFLCYRLVDDLPPVQPLPAKTAGHITFGSFNNLAKISPATIKLWSAVLAAVPNSKLLIKTSRFGDDATRVRAAARFAALNLPMDRVQLVGPEHLQFDHLRQYGRVDIALDTFPYNGTTTTCEALAMGVPVVSLAGDRHVSRVGLSLLNAAGYGHWVTDDRRRFVEIAAMLASNLSQLASIRAGLRDQMRHSVLCDGAAYVRKIERIYRDAWVRWCQR